MILFTSYYHEKNEQRKNELLYCLKQNVSNKFISKLYVLCESGFTDLIKEIESPKLVVLETLKRPFFHDVIQVVNKYSEHGTSIIANTDIYFDDSISLVNKCLSSLEVFCLTRWNNNGRNVISFYGNFRSQDAWIFKGKLPSNIGNYYMGLPGCDNRFAKELLESGYKIQNPSLSIRAVHVHNSNLRNYNKIVDLVPGKYAYPLPKELKNHKTEWGQEKEKEIRKKFMYRKWRNTLEGTSFNLIGRITARIHLFFIK
jgi:hypothetical protein